MSIEETYNFIQEKLQSFKNYIEIDNWRNFLMLVIALKTASSQSMIARLMGKGGKETRLVIAYDPEKKIYYTKLKQRRDETNSIIFYLRDEGENAQKVDFINTLESELITKNFSKFEIKNILPPKMTILVPRVYDFSDKLSEAVNSKSGINTTFEALFIDFTEFIVTLEVPFFFLLKDDDEKGLGDLCLTFSSTINPLIPEQELVHVFDVYVDKEKKIRNYEIIRMVSEDDKKGEVKVEYLDKMREFSHGELFNSQFSVIIPIKSFNKP